MIAVQQLKPLEKMAIRRGIALFRVKVMIYCRNLSKCIKSKGEDVLYRKRTACANTIYKKEDSSLRQEGSYYVDTVLKAGANATRCSLVN